MDTELCRQLYQQMVPATGLNCEGTLVLKRCVHHEWMCCRVGHSLFTYSLAHHARTQTGSLRNNLLTAPSVRMSSMGAQDIPTHKVDHCETQV